MTWLLLLLLVQPDAPLKRPYHRVTLAQMATTKWTHVLTCGVVTYRRAMQDGDQHLTLSIADNFVVLEIIPSVPMPSPRKGQRIDAWGIARIDRGHRTARYPSGWPELHPLEGWTPVESCRQK